MSAVVDNEPCKRVLTQCNKTRNYNNKLSLSVGNFIGGTLATSLVSFQVAMNQIIEGKPVHLSSTYVIEDS